MKLQKDLREFIELLNSRGIDYLIVGGHAVAFHGYPRYTGDIDFLVRPNAENGARIVEALRAFGFGELSLTPADFLRPESIVQLGRPPNRIDLLTSISGVSFDEAWSSRASAELDGVPVLFLSRENLIKNKQASGRPKDLADAATLLARKPRS